MTDLDDFISAYRGGIANLAEGGMQPDVADVVDRARAVDEDAVPHGLRESLPSSPRADATEEHAEDLAVFAGAYRERVQRRADERRLCAVPTPRASRRGLWMAAAGIAAAAAVVLVVGRATLSDSASLEPDAEPLEAAERVLLRPSTETGEVEVRQPRRSATSGPEVESPPPDEPAEELSAAEPESVDAPLVSASKSAPRRSLSELERRVHERWHKGDLAGAESDLREIIRRAGRDRRAELAYGDLFAIARQRGGPSAQARVWKQYLRRFPKGRFSDDVEAGLCRSDSSGRRAACWAKYLRHHPAGAHAAEARKAADSESPPDR